MFENCRNEKRNVTTYTMSQGRLYLWVIFYSNAPASKLNFWRYLNLRDFFVYRGLSKMSQGFSVFNKDSMDYSTNFKEKYPKTNFFFSIFNFPQKLIRKSRTLCKIQCIFNFQHFKIVEMCFSLRKICVASNFFL
jgi:hypothetical protein